MFQQTLDEVLAIFDRPTEYGDGDPGPGTYAGGSQWGDEDPWLGVVDLSTVVDADRRRLREYFVSITPLLSARGLALAEPWCGSASESLVPFGSVQGFCTPVWKKRDHIVLALVPSSGGDAPAEAVVRKLKLRGELGRVPNDCFWVRRFDTELALTLSPLSSAENLQKLKERSGDAGARIEYRYQIAYANFLGGLVGSSVMQCPDETALVRPAYLLDALGDIIRSARSREVSFTTEAWDLSVAFARTVEMGNVPGFRGPQRAMASSPKVNSFPPRSYVPPEAPIGFSSFAKKRFGLKEGEVLPLWYGAAEFWERAYATEFNRYLRETLA
ncbi:MAG: hypothetical protein AAB839_03145 [Patescibacteria group bacterium]